MRYAIIENGVVVNVVEANAAIAPNWVQSDDAAIGWSYVEGVFTAPPATEPPPVPADPCEWLLDIAPFTDRLEPYKFQIDTHTDAFVQYFNRDLNRRKYVDLKDPRVAAALYYMAGQTIPSVGTIAIPIFDAAFAASVLNTPVILKENFALRKAYFS